MKKLLTIYSLLFITIILSMISCATPPQSGILSCKSLCHGKNVELFQDEFLECRCSK